MAISYLCGFDLGTVSEAYKQTLSGAGNAITVQSTTVHAGGNALKCDASAAPGTCYATLSSRAAAGTLRSLFQSVSLYMTAPAGLVSAMDVIQINGGTGYQIRLNATSSIVQIRKNGVGIANGAITLPSFTTWRRIDVDVGYNAGNGIRVYIDGTLMVSADSETITGFPVTQLDIGVVSGSGAPVYYFDDIVAYDAALPTVTDYSLNLLLPTTDTAVGNWRRNDGTTSTGLSGAVDNTPPTGTAVTSTLASNYVQNGTAGSSSANDNLDLTTTAYTSITGLTQASQVKAVMAVCNDAQQVTTGSPKSGAVALFSNPTASDQTFDFGLQQGTAGSTTAAAQGAFPAGWGTHAGGVVTSPSVTASSGVGVRVKRTGTYTRVISVDFMGVYVMWTAAAATSFVFADRRVRQNSLLRR